MANRSLMDSPGSGVYGRYRVLGHAQLTTDPGGAGLPGLPNDNDLRRIILRPKGEVAFTLDGTDPTEPEAMYMLEDEIVVLDTDGTGVQLAGAGVDVRIIYLGL